MAKYKNTTKFRIIVSDGKNLINFLPGEVLETTSIIPEISQFMLFDTPKPVKLVEEEILETDSSDQGVPQRKKKTYRVKGK